jgi:hypothetical protein
MNVGGAHQAGSHGFIFLFSFFFSFVVVLMIAVYI